MADLKVTLVKSTIGAIPKHRRTVEALGLKKLNKTVVLPDNAATRGMVQQVRHLVKVEAVSYTHLDVYKRQVYTMGQTCTRSEDTQEKQIF